MVFEQKGMAKYNLMCECYAQVGVFTSKLFCGCDVQKYDVKTMMPILLIPLIICAQAWERLERAEHERERVLRDELIDLYSCLVF